MHDCLRCFLLSIAACRDQHDACALALRLCAPVCRRQKAAHAAFEEQEIARLRQVRDPLLSSRRLNYMRQRQKYDGVHGLHPKTAGVSPLVMPCVQEKPGMRTSQYKVRMLSLFMCQ